MKANETLKKLVESASLNSILGGGLSVPIIHLRKSTEHIDVSVRVPGVKAEKLFVEITKKKVMVYRLLDLERNDGEIFQDRFLVHWFPITKDIDFKNIHAYHEKETLKIILPLEEAHGDIGPNRKIGEN